MRQIGLLVCAGLLALPACNQEPALGKDDGSKRTAAASSQPRAAPASGDITAMVGPIPFHYDPAQLTLTEVELPVPPDYAAPVWALKLIPADRAKNLGNEACSYGESGLTQSCNPEQEAGLALALLERPLADYRETFAEGDLAGELEPSRLDGAEGFELTIGAEGSGIRYRFIPVEDRTLLIARQFTDDQDQQVALAEVLGSIAQNLRH